MQHQLYLSKDWAAAGQFICFAWLGRVTSVRYQKNRTRLFVIETDNKMVVLYGRGSFVNRIFLLLL